MRTSKSALSDSSGSLSDDNICCCKSDCISSSSFFSFCALCSFLGEVVVVETAGDADRGDEIEGLREDARGDLASSFCGDLILVGDLAVALFTWIFLSFGLGGSLGIWP